MPKPEKNTKTPTLAPHTSTHTHTHKHTHTHQNTHTQIIDFQSPKEIPKLPVLHFSLALRPPASDVSGNLIILWIFKLSTEYHERSQGHDPLQQNEYKGIYSHRTMGYLDREQWCDPKLLTSRHIDQLTSKGQRDQKPNTMNQWIKAPLHVMVTMGTVTNR